MSDQFDLNFDLAGKPNYIKIFGADGYGDIHKDITHCHRCWPRPQVTNIIRDDDLPGYQFSCSTCKSKWNQTDAYIEGYNKAVEKVNLRYPLDAVDERS